MKELVSRVKGFLQNLLGDLLPSLLRNGDAAIRVVNIVKEVIESPALNVTVALTPTKKDNIALVKAKAVTTALIVKLGLAMGLVDTITAGQDNVKNVAKWITERLKESSSDSQRAVFYRELAGLVLESLMDDGKITLGEYVAIAQFLFKKRL